MAVQWRKALTWTVVVVGAGAYAAHSAFTQFMSGQTKANESARLKERLRRHFLKVQEDAVTVFSALLPDGDEQLNKLLRLPELRETARDSSKLLTQEQKLATWDELKLHTLVYTMSSIYLSVLLFALIRTQLNILGRRAYTNMTHEEKEENHNLSDASERAFLSFQFYILRRGCSLLVEDLTSIIKPLASSLSIKKKVEISEIVSLLAQARIAMDSHRSFVTYLLPNEDNEAIVLAESGISAETSTGNIGGRSPDLQVRALLDETRDLLESSDFASVCRDSLDNLCVLLHKRVDEIFLPAQTTQLGEIDKILLPMPTVVAGLGRFAKETLDPITNQNAARALASSDELDAFSAVAYASFESFLYK